MGVIGLVSIYTFGYLLWYSTTALGLHPLLDAKELIVFAIQIASNEIPKEPFYRAPLYPFLLSLLLSLGIEESSLPIVARMINGCLHIGSTIIVGKIASILWRNKVAGLIAVILYGLNPVALHFASDVLDITFSVFLMVFGLYCFIAKYEYQRKNYWLGFAGVLLTLAVLTRPQMVTILVVWCGLCIYKERQACILILLPVVLLMGSLGFANYQLSGEVRFLPWQGAFNLWAANNDRSNGRYFAHEEGFISYQHGVNPAREESREIFLRENPSAQPTIDNMVTYWKQKTLAAIVDDPISWLRLMTYKTWYLLNNCEQYNNKTYFYHKERSPWLKWNPICWAIIVSLGLVGIFTLIKNNTVKMMTLLIVAYAAGLLLTFVSARFRLPLVPLLCIFSGSALLRLLSPQKNIALYLLGLVLITISLVRLPGDDRDETVLHDMLLLARASVAIGDYVDAQKYTQQVLNQYSDNIRANEYHCIAGYNRWLYQSSQQLFDWSTCEKIAKKSTSAAHVLGVWYWKQEKKHLAREIWLDQLQKLSGYQESLGYLLGSNTMSIKTVLERILLNKDTEVFLLAVLAWKGVHEAAQLYIQNNSEESLLREFEALDQIFN